MSSQPTETIPSNVQTAILEEAVHLNPNVVRVRLRPKSGNGRFIYSAGQYLALHILESQFRCYSMVHDYEPDKPLELHVRLYPGGLFSEWVRQRATSKLLSSNDPVELRLSGPYGECTWKSPSRPGATTVMLATGTGIAPIWALLEQALPASSDPVFLYWGGRVPQDLYLSDPLRGLEKAFPHFHFVPVMCDPIPGWTGRVGTVEQCAASDHPELRQSRVYACGSPSMVQAAAALFIKNCGLDEDHFHADPFEHPVPSQEAPGEYPTLNIFVRTPQGHEEKIHARTGISLMTALSDSGHTQGICGGRATCGNCRVKVGNHRARLFGEQTKSERRLLASFEDALPEHRLSCQIALTKDLDELRVEISTPSI
ncbi:MAG: flavin reductase family protein [Thiobacillus sp.]